MTIKNDVGLDGDTVVLKVDFNKLRHPSLEQRYIRQRIKMVLDNCKHYLPAPLLLEHKQ